MDNLSNWHNELFFREYEFADANKIIVGCVAEYLYYRNITPTKEQREYIIRFLVDEMRSNKFAYAKPCLVRWSLRKYDDPRNNNLSAGVLFEYIRMGYRSHEYQQLVYAYLESKTNQLEEKPLSSMNAQAMADAWDKCVESVRSGQVNLDDWFWVLGYRHLARELKYRPDQAIIDRCQEKAQRRAYDLRKNEAEDLSLKGKHDQARSIIREMEDKSFANGDAVANLRRKYVALEYIETQVLMPI